MIVGGQTEARAQLSSTIMSRLTTALHLSCTALSQSESSNFFMCIIKGGDP